MRLSAVFLAHANINFTILLVPVQIYIILTHQPPRQDRRGHGLFSVQSYTVSCTHINIYNKAPMSLDLEGAVLIKLCNFFPLFFHL